jgi:3,4-dihydroxy-2-butanone 4-phosphate synthase
MDDGRVHIDRTVPFVAVESVVPELKGPGAVHYLLAVYAGIEQRHGHRRFDRRT